MSVTLAFAVAVLYALGTYLLLQRKLTRILLGLGLYGHGAVLLLLLVGGRAGDPPIVHEEPSSTFADPLPQALSLTAIVISFGMTAFLLALAYRSWTITEDDTVQTDIEDVRVALRSARRALRFRTPYRFDPMTGEPRPDSADRTSDSRADGEEPS